MNAYLIESKKEYIKSLCSLITPQIFQGLKSIYRDACRLSKTPSNQLKTFQKMLEDVPRWDVSIVREEYNRIVDTTRCKYIETLIDAVVVCSTKVLTAVNNGTQQSASKINIEVPNGPEFIHNCYIIAARTFWIQPHLFSTDVIPTDYQNNLVLCQTRIDEAVEKAKKVQ